MSATTMKTENGWFPTEWWELAELVLAGCPDTPLKAFRSTLLRGKPLMAGDADAAIKGAHKTLATGPLVMGEHTVKNCKRKRNEPLCKIITLKRRVEAPKEDMEQRLARQRWFLRHDRTVIFAGPNKYRLTKDERAIAAEANTVSFLEWDDSEVHRVEHRWHAGQQQR